RIVEHRVHVVDHVEHVRRRGAREQQRAAGGGVHQAVPGVHRDREHRTLLPLEDVSLRVALLPDFGRAATLDDEKDLLVHVLLGVERARGRALHDIAAPLGLGAVKLDIVAAAAGALPGRERQVLHFAYADAAAHRDALGRHEGVVGGGLFLELAESGLARARRLVPAGLVFFVWHDLALDVLIYGTQFR